MKTLDKLPKSIYSFGEYWYVINITYMPNNKLWKVSYHDMCSTETFKWLAYDSDIDKALKKTLDKINDYMKDLKKISTYAKERGVSVQAVYHWIATNKVKVVEIDGVKFIKEKKTNNNN